MTENRIRELRRSHNMSQEAHKTGRNAVDFYRMICIRDESVQNPEANTLCFFAFVPILV